MNQEAVQLFNAAAKPKSAIKPSDTFALEILERKKPKIEQ